MIDWQRILKKVKDIAGRNEGRDEKLKRICDLLSDRVPHYNWVGFYLADDSRSELALGPCAGAPTKHVRIDFGRGICGQVAESKKTRVVQDVSKENNYLSCSANVMSEIVVPIFKSGELIGELDIDSHRISPFGKDDRTYLEHICEIAGELFQKGKKE